MGACDIATVAAALPDRVGARLARGRDNVPGAMAPDGIPFRAGTLSCGVWSHRRPARNAADVGDLCTGQGWAWRVAIRQGDIGHRALAPRVYRELLLPRRANDFAVTVGTVIAPTRQASKGIMVSRPNGMRGTRILRILRRQSARCLGWPREKRLPAPESVAPDHSSCAALPMGRSSARPSRIRTSRSVFNDVRSTV